MATTQAGQLFRFVQLEYPWRLGPEDGRYAIREHTGELPNQVLLIGTLGARERRRLATRRKARDASPEPDPAPVETTRATLIDAEALGGSDDAGRWLGDVDADALVDDAIARLNRVLHAQRVAAANAYARPVSRAQALVVRIGYGDGDAVSQGRWVQARELSPPDAKRKRPLRHEAALRPHERLAAILGGRDVTLACEELALRARTDLDAERYREAALQLRAALVTAVHELAPWRERTMLAQRLDAVVEAQEDVDAVADAALRGGLAPEQIDVIGDGLRRVESALRARTAGGFD